MESAHEKNYSHKLSTIKQRNEAGTKPTHRSSASDSGKNLNFSANSHPKRNTMRMRSNSNGHFDDAPMKNERTGGIDTDTEPTLVNAKHSIFTYVNGSRLVFEQIPTLHKFSVSHFNCSSVCLCVFIFAAPTNGSTAKVRIIKSLAIFVVCAAEAFELIPIQSDRNVCHTIVIISTLIVSADQRRAHVCPVPCRNGIIVHRGNAKDIKTANARRKSINF